MEQNSPPVCWVICFVITNAFLFLHKNRILNLWRYWNFQKKQELPSTIKAVCIPYVMCNVSTAKLSALLLCKQTGNEIAFKGKVPIELLICVCVCVYVCVAHSIIRFLLYSTLAKLHHGLPQDQDLNFLFVCLCRLQKIQLKCCKNWELTVLVEVQLK